MSFLERKGGFSLVAIRCRLNEALEGGWRVDFFPDC
jgi:hypothetical protein